MRINSAPKACGSSSPSLELHTPETRHTRDSRCVARLALRRYSTASVPTGCGESALRKGASRSLRAIVALAVGQRNPVSARALRVGCLGPGTREPLYHGAPYISVNTRSGPDMHSTGECAGEPVPDEKIGA